MVRKSEGKEYKSTDNCEVEADFKESLLKHLDDHGVVSVLSSAKFGKYCGCFWEEIQDAISTVGKAAASGASAGGGICESWSPVASAKSPSAQTRSTHLSCSSLLFRRAGLMRQISKPWPGRSRS